MKLVLQSLLLIFSFAIVFAWQKTLLAEYTIPTIGFLIFLYIIVYSRRGGKREFNIQGGTWSIFILNIVILLFIFSTGGITSNLFFLLYFLGFGVTFVLEPITVFIFTLGVIIIFLPEAIKDDVTGNLLRLGSLALISPLAFFFGKEYKEREKEEGKIEEVKERAKYAGDTISKDIGEVLEEEKDSLKKEDVEKLNEVLEEAEDLREETKE